jgi:hypothetical protein
MAFLPESDIYERYRQLMLRSEIVRFSIVFKNADLEFYIEPEYLANSTLLNAGEDEQGTYQISKLVPEYGYVVVLIYSR